MTDEQITEGNRTGHPKVLSVALRGQRQLSLLYTPRLLEELRVNRFLSVTFQKSL